MYDLDVAIAAIADQHSVAVTRYADDITASCDDHEALLRFERGARQLIRLTRHPRLRFNDAKRGLYFVGERRMVTGLIITPDRKISIGRERKRPISAMIYRATLGQLSLEQLHELHGLSAFAKSVEPRFIRSMSAKYERDVLRYVRGLVQAALNSAASS